MKSKLIDSTKWNLKTLKNDILAGVVIALVSIPISMGYAQVAGLPAVYGLYGSLLPVLVYALFCSSPQFIVGVDAMPAAMVGSSLAALGIAGESSEALSIVPCIALLVSLWLLVFRVINAGRVVKYISNPVMGGFISGVGLTIILMQLPKLFGGSAGTGEIIELIPHIIRETGSFNLLSCILGFGTVAVIMVLKKLVPKFPSAVLMLLLGILLTSVFHVDRYGVKLLSAVEGGLPKFMLPDVRVLLPHLTDWIILSFTIALVIMAQTLLTANRYSKLYDYPLDAKRELTAYALMNAAACVSGSCPINGSVSRTGMSDQFGSRSQIVSLVAFFTMLLVVLFATGYFIYLPVPVLTGIVITALIGILDFKQAKRLWKCNRSEFFIFVTAFAGVLVFGTIYGVVIGVVLSFMQVVKKAVVPPRTFLGKVSGHHGYYNLKRTTSSRPIQNTVIYRFGGNLFFANIGTFEADILSALKPDTKYVIVDGGGIGNIDITAADRIVALADKLNKKGIKFYLTEHPEVVNDQLRAFGGESLIENGNVRRTVSLALRDCGFVKPYPLEGYAKNVSADYIEATDENLAEFEWAFGKDAESKMHKMAGVMAGEMISSLNAADKVSDSVIKDVSIEKLEEHLKWGKIGLFDEEKFLNHLEVRLEELHSRGKITDEMMDQLEVKIENRKHDVEEKIHHLNPKAIELLHRHMMEVEDYLKENYPEEYEHIKNLNNRLQKK